MVKELKDFDVNVYGYDPLLPEEVIRHFGAIPLMNLDKKMDAVIIAVAHSQFRKMGMDDFTKFINSHPVIIDVRGMLAGSCTEGIYYRKL